VLIVFPDTNALFGDPLLTADAGRAMLGALRPGAAEMHISPVVIAELARQRADRVRTEAEGVRARLEKLGRLSGADPQPAVDAADALVAEGLQWGDRRWAEITAAPAVVALPWPQTRSDRGAHASTCPHGSRGDGFTHHVHGLNCAQHSPI